MTITLTDEQAERIKAAVETGAYASNSEVVRDALREWELAQEVRKQALVDLKGEIAKGLADVKAGRVRDFDAETIIQEGKKRLAARNFRSA